MFLCLTVDLNSNNLIYFFSTLELKNTVIFIHSMHLQVENSVHRVLAKERASQSKALDLQSQLNRAKAEQSQLKRSKEEVCEMSSLDSRS